MKKVLNPNFQAGSTTCNEPRLVGDILAEMLSSDSLFVKAFRQSAASHEDAAAGGQAADEDYAAVERETDFLPAWMVPQHRPMRGREDIPAPRPHREDWQELYWRALP